LKYIILYFTLFFTKGNDGVKKTSEKFSKHPFPVFLQNQHPCRPCENLESLRSRRLL